MARFLTALFLAGLLLVPSPLQSAPADLTVLNEALAALRTQHWNPSLNMPAIVRAGVPGLNRALARAGVTQRVTPIPEGADEPTTIAAFGQRLDEAVRLAGGRVVERDLLYGALRSMFGRAGRWPHTGFLTCPRRDASGRCLGRHEIAGIGIYLFRGVDQWVFSQVFPGGPAARAGAHEGDAVLKIDDVAVESELPLGEVNAMIFGTAGTQVRLTLRRGTEELRVSVPRGFVNEPVEEGKMLDDGIAYLRVYGFPSVARERIHTRFAQLLQGRPRGLVLDLRSNSGGGTRGASALLGLFLPKGTPIHQTITRTRQYSDVTTDVPIAPTLPLIVLINQYTLSYGEVVAAVFKETGRARLVGERTYGAVELAPPQRSLSDGSSVVIPTGRTLTPKGREIEGRGVSPDVEFPHDLAAQRDLLLERAVQLLLRRLR